MSCSRSRVPAGARGVRAAGALLALAALCPAGCSSALSFYDVYGVVTLNGKPVEYAEMSIHPATDQPIRGRTLRVPVVNGRYDTWANGGVAAGPAELTIVVAEPGTMRIKNPEDISSDESERFVRVKKQKFTVLIDVNRKEINVELP